MTKIDTKIEAQSINESIIIKMSDSRVKREVEFEYHHSMHSQQRSKQRGIDKDKLSIALSYGNAYYKQGYIFYVLGEDQIPEYLTAKKSKYVNTIVVTDSESDRIITCYRCKEPHRHIKKKSKGFAIGADEKKELLDKILKQYNEQLSPYYAAARLWVDGVIDPIETRKIVSMGIEAANHSPITERYNVGVIQT